MILSTVMLLSLAISYVYTAMPSLTGWEQVGLTTEGELIRAVLLLVVTGGVFVVSGRRRGIHKLQIKDMQEKLDFLRAELQGQGDQALEMKSTMEEQLRKWSEIEQKEAQAREQIKVFLLAEEEFEKKIKACGEREQALSKEKQQQQLVLDELQTKLKKQTSQRAEHNAGNSEVISFLRLLQEKGRFLDFIMDDITSYSNDQVGAASRIVHQGCARVMREFVAVEPCAQDREGSSITLESNYDTNCYRVLGSLSDQEGDFTGKVLHRGWTAGNITLPKSLGVPSKVISPVEVEV